MQRAKTSTAAALLAALLTSTTSAASDRVSLELAVDGTAARGALLSLEALAEIADGWHINAHQPNETFLIPTVLELALPPDVTVAEMHYPPALEKSFAFAPGKVLLIYEGKLGIAAALRIPADFAADTLTIAGQLRYQACNDTTCLPPRKVAAELEVALGEERGSPLRTESSALGGATGDPGIFARWLSERGLLLTLLGVAFLGLGLNLTPCVYPLISVTVAYFGGQGGGRTRIAWLASVYVLGIAISFSALGLAAAMSGGVFGAALQKPPVLLAIAAVMIALALSSFGVYQLQPPVALMRWAGAAGSGSAGSLFMGLTMGIVAAPCVGPIVLGLLLFVGSQQDPWLGFLLFFVLALGMGSPYLLLAMAAGSIRQLPRSGEWLEWVERLFGCILLAMAAYFVAPVAPDPLATFLLPAVLAASGLYLGFVNRAGRSIPFFAALKGASGVALLSFAVWLAMPVAGDRAIAWETIDGWAIDRESPQPVLIDFVAEWCIPCREMDHSTYVHEGVIEEAERFRMVKADLTNEDDSTERIIEEFDVRGVPTVILRDAAGMEIHRMVGYVGPDEMLAAMRRVGDSSH